MAAEAQTADAAPDALSQQLPEGSSSLVCASVSPLRGDVIHYTRTRNRFKIVPVGKMPHEAVFLPLIKMNGQGDGCCAVDDKVWPLKRCFWLMESQRCLQPQCAFDGRDVRVTLWQIIRQSHALLRRYYKDGRICPLCVIRATKDGICSCKGRCASPVKRDFFKDDIENFSIIKPPADLFQSLGLQCVHSFHLAALHVTLPQVLDAE